MIKELVNFSVLILFLFQFFDNVPMTQMSKLWLLTGVFLLLHCSHQDENKRQLASKYEAMRARFFNDSSFVNLVDQKVTQGDTNMIKLKTTLQLSFNELVQQPDFDSLQLEKFIAAMDISLNVLRKFEGIEAELQRTLRENDAQYSAEELREMEAARQAAIDSLRARGGALE
jgi:hypothetical protein